MSFTPPSATGLTELSKEHLIALVKALREANVYLAEENRRQADMIVALEQRVDALERRLALNSGNSSKPPSSDGPAKPKARGKGEKNRRGKSGRKPGGQLGHKGTTLKQTDTPDEVIDHHPTEAICCLACRVLLCMTTGYPTARWKTSCTAFAMPITCVSCRRLSISTRKHGLQ